MIKRILKEVKEYKVFAILTPVFGGLEVLMETIIPYITAMLIDEGVNKGAMSEIGKYGSLMLIVALFSLTFAIIAGRFAAKASTGFAANLRGSMYRKIQTLSFSNIDKFSTAGLITRMTTDVNSVQNAFQMCIRMAVRAPLMLVFSLIMCMIINKSMSLIFLTAMLVLLLASIFVIKFVVKYFTQMMQRYEALNLDVQENVSGVRVVKAYVREDYETEKFKKASAALKKISIKAEKLIALVSPIMMFVIYGLILAISWFGAKFIVSGSMTTGDLTALFSYIMNVMMSLLMLLAVFVMLTMSIASAKRISEVLDEEPSINNPENPIFEIKDGSIVFDDVSFSYKDGEGEDTLSDISFNIHSGETIGIIGPTGSGKSSLVNLISRLYDVKKGKILVGGVDVRDYDIKSLRKNVSVVLQKNVLFSGSILENLRWGNENATFEDCQKACQASCADEFIEQMPEKYESHIEQGGSNVSGGQKQRLCIARALVGQPKILILDDSTSAVDTATDKKIREAFKTVIPGTTKLIIAQRISSVMEADRILVIESGKIIGMGTHDELLESNDLYKEIFETQTSSGGDFDENPSNDYEAERAFKGKEV